MLQSLAWEAKLDSPEPVKKKKKEPELSAHLDLRLGNQRQQNPDVPYQKLQEVNSGFRKRSCLEKQGDKWLKKTPDIHLQPPQDPWTPKSSGKTGLCFSVGPQERLACAFSLNVMLLKHFYWSVFHLLILLMCGIFSLLLPILLRSLSCLLTL